MKIELTNYAKKPLSAPECKSMISDLFVHIFGEINSEEIEELGASLADSGSRFSGSKYIDPEAWSLVERSQAYIAERKNHNYKFRHKIFSGQITITLSIPKSSKDYGNTGRYLIDIGSSFHRSIYSIVRRLETFGYLRIIPETRLDSVKEKAPSMLDTPKPEGFGAFS